MNHLIVYSHPNPRSFSHAIKEAVAEVSLAKGHETAVRDLYAIGFDPVLKGSDFVGLQSGKVPADIAQEQERVAWADLMTFVYPVWWTGLPAMVKGYIDRVYSNGFAYGYGETGPFGLLKGKKVAVFNTMGTPNTYYEQSGMLPAMRETSDTGIWEFCGIEVAHHAFLGGVPSADDATRKGMLDQVRRAMEKLL